MADFEAHLPLPQVVDLDYAYGYPESYKRGTLMGLTSRWTNGSLMLSPIIAQLKSSRLQVEKAMISCLGTEADLYVFVGNDPLPNTASVPAAYIRNGRVRVMQLSLKFRYPGKPEPSPGNQIEDESSNKASRRTKERKIGYIIEKVARWRNLYNGMVNSKGEHVRMTLEEAAMQVGISKKSLDDYLLQLRWELDRFGRRFGFNFQEHKDEKVGVLRAYVKKYKGVEQELEYFKTEQAAEPSEQLKTALTSKGTSACKHQRCCMPPQYLVQKVLEHPKFYNSS